MPAFIKWVIIVIFIAVTGEQVFCQNLQYIAPVLANKIETRTDASFITTTDMRGIGKNSRRYANAIEIFDEKQPWPPRWYFSAAISHNDSLVENKELFLDARMQNGYMTFFRSAATSDEPPLTGVMDVICNAKLESIDTFKNMNRRINNHDFRINDKKEKLVALKEDTVLNLSLMSGNPEDTAVKATFDIIEILDSLNNVVFQWNPVQVLGTDALYFPYGSAVTFSIKRGYVDWSHLNAFDWDFDGNIIYSFRHIGIGKISRNDGHVIWRFDRNKIPYKVGLDTVAFYCQHGLEKMDDNADFTTYTLYSDGDHNHLVSFGLEFAMSKKNNEMLWVKRKMPEKKITAFTLGNYDLEKNGDYVLNYGTYTFKDSNEVKTFLEYGNADKVYALYRFTQKINAYKVHKLNVDIPPRPIVAKKRHQLIAKGEMTGWAWYELSGDNNTTVEKAGEGESFTPEHAGVYCVVGKYGIGYAVSLPFTFKP